MDFFLENPWEYKIIFARKVLKAFFQKLEKNKRRETQNNFIRKLLAIGSTAGRCRMFLVLFFVF